MDNYTRIKNFLLFEKLLESSLRAWNNLALLNLWENANNKNDGEMRECREFKIVLTL